MAATLQSPPQEAESVQHPGDIHSLPTYQAHNTALTDLKSRITQHYDLSSVYYHRLWGQHIHHGLFTDTVTTKEAAQINLIDHLVKLSGIKRGSTVLDVGCGIGGTTRYLARELGCEVTGITISSEQVKIARGITAQEEAPVAAVGATSLADGEYTPCGNGKVRYIHLDAEMAAEYFSGTDHGKTFDYIWISECLSHIPGQAVFFKTAFSLLSTSGSDCSRSASDDPAVSDATMVKTGKLVIADWFKSETVTPTQMDADIKPIEDGMLLPGLKTAREYVSMAETAGFKIAAGPEDLSEGVKKTWDISWSLISSPSLWAFAISQGRDGLSFLQSFRAMRRGYANGAFRYAVMVFEKM